MKDTEIEELRLKEHFLPLYSDYYFEKKRGTRDGVLSICVFAFILFLLINVFTKFENTFPIVCFIIVLIVIFYNTVFFDKIMKKKKMLGFFLRPDGVIGNDYFGRSKRISYIDLRQDILNGHMKYEETGIVVGNRRNKLVFHYEIGDSKAQNHVKECYEELERYIQIKLLPYEKMGLELLDKKYYYDKSRKRQTISLIISVISLWTYVGLGGIGNMEMVFFCCLFIAPWQYFSLYVLAKNAELTKVTYEKIQKILEVYPGIQLKGKYIGWGRFVIMAVLVLSLNSLIIFTA